ncbi:MAG: ABC transporter permease [Candidatus Promineifilaceae bacterium]
MSEQTIQPRQTIYGRIRHTIIENPITLKELRSRMRGRRAFVVLTVYLLIMSAGVILIYMAYAASSRSPFGPDPREAGKVLFTTVLGTQVFLVVFMGPSFTAGSISGEKERQTYDLLRTTLLSANQFVMGKLISALSYVLLLILAAIPLQSIAFLLGGVAFIELFMSQLLLLVGAVTFAMWGLYCSTIMRSTLSATVLTFAGALFVTFGTPLIVMLVLSLAGVFLFSVSTTWVYEMVLVYAGLLLASTNLPATLIVSDIFLLQEDALFFYKETFGPQTVYLFSPWMLYLVVYIFAAWLLYWLSVRRIRRIADR